jgi:hypothetical protein
MGWDLLYSSIRYFSEHKLISSITCLPALSQLVQLRHIPLDKVARERLRPIWKTTVNDHLKDGAPFPVSVNERLVRSPTKERIKHALVHSYDSLDTGNPVSSAYLVFDCTASAYTCVDW